MNFEDEEEWDLELLVKLVESEEQAIAARRGASATPAPPSSSSSPLPFQPSIAVLPPSKQDNSASPASPALDLQLQAERELSNPCQKSEQSIAVLTSSIEEELRCLQAEVLFKDQEILEVKRACTEKSEQLKRIRDENEELRKQLEEVKQAKRLENLDAKTRQKDAKKRVYGTSKDGHVDVCVSQEAPDQGLWYPPWTPTVPLCDGLHTKNMSSPDVQSKNKITGRDEPQSVKNVDARTQNGTKGHGGATCISSNKGEINDWTKQSKQQETIKMATGYGNTQGKEQNIQGTAGNSSWESMFRINLLNIWCPRNMKEEGKELAAKLSTACEADMRILLSMNDKGTDVTKPLTDSSSLEASSSHGKKNVSKIHIGNVDERRAFKTSSFPSVLVKVANGLISSWSLFLALFDLSEIENVQVSESALRVLHFLLIQDEGCHKHLFERKILIPQPEKELLRAANSRLFFKENASKPCKDLNGDSSSTNVFKRYFFSPRITWHHKTFPQFRHNGQGVPLQEIVDPQIIEERIEENLQGVCSESSNHGSILGKIFQRALDKAIRGCSESIGVTASSILVTIVTNTEPFTARESFGFILFNGSLAILLRMSAILDVRVQGVRIFHSLVHCPHVLRKLLEFQEQLDDEPAAPLPNQSTEILQEVEFDGRSAEENPFLQNNEDVSPQCETARAVCSIDEKRSFEALEGLIYCLSEVGVSSQAYSLRRNALRVLTFIATSDERGAAFLLAKEMVLVKALDVERADNGTKDNKSLASMPGGSLPMHLIALLDRELRMEEEDGCSQVTMEHTEERDYVIRETLTLLCRLASHSTHSSKTVAVLTRDKNIARLSISVINRLMNRDTPSEVLPAEQRSMMASPVNVIELCKGLRRRILASISNV